LALKSNKITATIEWMNHRTMNLRNKNKIQSRVVIKSVSFLLLVPFLRRGVKFLLVLLLNVYDITEWNSTPTTRTWITVDMYTFLHIENEKNMNHFPFHASADASAAAMHHSQFS
jgi:hypothetical protein